MLKLLLVTLLGVNSNLKLFSCRMLKVSSGTDYAEKDYYVYDFALPMLLINVLYYGQTQYLKNWLNMPAQTVYDT